MYRSTNEEANSKPKLEKLVENEVSMSRNFAFRVVSSLEEHSRRSSISIFPSFEFHLVLELPRHVYFENTRYRWRRFSICPARSCRSTLPSGFKLISIVRYSSQVLFKVTLLLLDTVVLKVRLTNLPALLTDNPARLIGIVLALATQCSIHGNSMKS